MDAIVIIKKRYLYIKTKTQVIMAWDFRSPFNAPPCIDWIIVNKKMILTQNHILLRYLLRLSGAKHTPKSKRGKHFGCGIIEALQGNPAQLRAMKTL
jgi:hypothetical protein